MFELVPTLKQRFLDNNGAPLAGGMLYSYVAGTTTPKATYTDASGNTPNTNPVILNARGECDLWVDPNSGAYKFVLTDSLGNVQWTLDNVTLNDLANGVQSINGNSGVLTLNAITQLMGDVSGGPASGFQSVSSTVNSVGGSSAANVHAAEQTVNTAQSGRKFLASPSDGTSGAPSLRAIVSADLPTASVSTDGKLTSTDWNTFNNKQSALGYTPENVANKGTNNGYCALDSGGKVPTANLPTVNAINQLTGDVTAGPASGSASAAATVVSVGGSAAANVHTAEQTVNTSQSGNKVLASPSNGSLGTPAFRALVAGDLPTVPFTSGGTGQITQQAAMDALAGTQSSGKYLRSDGTHTTLSTIQAADVPTLNQNTTGTAANITGVSAIANGGTNNGSLAVTAGGVLYSDGTKIMNVGAGSSGNALLSNGSSPPSWGTPTASSPTNAYFNGFLANSGSNDWTTSSSTFAALSTAGTSTLTTRRSNSLTVTAAASNGAGITFTPSSASAIYLISVSTTAFNASAGAGMALKITDGTNDAGIAPVYTNSASSYYGVHATGIYAPGTTSAVTVFLYGATNAGTQRVGLGASITGWTGIEWTVVQIK